MTSGIGSSEPSGTGAQAEGGATDVLDLDPQFELHRRELTGYCYRMLGSGFDAEDAVQETMVRAWRSYDSFEGRSSIRSWLYRIATNVCLDMLRSRKRRARPMELEGPSSADSALGPMLAEHAWVQPVADARVLPPVTDPAELSEARESIRLAFVAALQHLPARQRAVLILREVLRWQAVEVAELLETTVASVNSALQRARATMAEVDSEAIDTARVDPEQQALLGRYVEAFEAYDIEALVALIRSDAEFSMPPFALWLQGTTDIAKWYVGQGAGCKDSRLVPIEANGCVGFGAYKQDPGGGHVPFAIQVIEISPDGWITGLHHFLDPKLFPEFGLPTYLPAE